MKITVSTNWANIFDALFLNHNLDLPSFSRILTKINISKNSAIPNAMRLAIEMRIDL